MSRERQRAIIKKAVALKQTVKNPFGSIFWTLISLLNPATLPTYWWELYSGNDPDQVSCNYIRYMKSWQNVIIWWGVSVLFLVMQDLSVTSENKILLKVVLSVTFILFFFATIMYGMFIDTVSTAFQNDGLRFGEQFGHYVGINLQICLTGMVTCLISVVITMYDVIARDWPISFYLTVIVTGGGLAAFTVLGTIQWRAMWLPIALATEEYALADASSNAEQLLYSDESIEESQSELIK